MRACVRLSSYAAPGQACTWCRGVLRAARRIHVPDKNTFLQDYDDDGEAAAGGRLLHLLQVWLFYSVRLPTYGYQLPQGHSNCKPLNRPVDAVGAL